jgi:Fe-Mn family superoxide dismutase
MTDGMERRDFMRNAGLLVGAATTAARIESPALAQTSSNARSKPMTYAAKPLPFDPKDIKGISEKVLVSHYENNYVGAVVLTALLLVPFLRQ